MELNHDIIDTPPRDAASVVMLRDGAQGLEVLLMRRHTDSAVLGGAYVFPGGKVDAADAGADTLARLDRAPAELHARLGEPALSPEQAAAFYVASGVRGMERGTMSEQREPDGSERFAQMELLRLALPKRVFSLSQIQYAADRLAWLYENRSLIGGLRYVEEPKIMRFFFGRLEPVGDWMEKLTAAFRRDFGDSL